MLYQLPWLHGVDLLWLFGRNIEGRGRGVLVNLYLNIFLVVLRKSAKILSMDGRLPLRDLTRRSNQPCPEFCCCEVLILTREWVRLFWLFFIELHCASSCSAGAQFKHPNNMFTKQEQRSWIKIEIARGRSVQWHYGWNSSVKGEMPFRTAVLQDDPMLTTTQFSLLLLCWMSIVDGLRGS
jgi:hypothetical protein